MKYLPILKYALVGLSALFVIVYLFFLNEQDIDFLLRWTYFLLIAAAALAFLFPVVNIIQNPKGSARSMVGFLIVAVVLGVSYALGSSEPVVTVVDNFDDPLTLKLADTGLFAMYASLIGAIVVAVGGEIIRVFK